MTLSVPPRFVPTLTEVVAPQQPLLASLDPVRSFASHPDEHASQAPTQRIMQRLDRVLEARLQDSVRQLLMTHTQALVPQLRDEIERLVRESVIEAFEQEAASPSTLINARTPGKPSDPS